MQWGTCLHWATCRWVTSQNWAQRTRLYLGKMFTYRICPWIHPVSKPIRVKICSLQSTKPLSQLCHLPHRYLIWMWESLISCPFVSLRISPINHLGQTFVEKNLILFPSKCSQCKQPLSHHQWLLLLVLPETTSSHWKWMKFVCCESLSLWATLNSEGQGWKSSYIHVREPKRDLQVAVSVLLQHE